jgi:hypothetical protein
MGFCTKCGRQLADGEVCNCQSQAINPQQTINQQPQQAYVPQPQAAPAGPNPVNEIVDLFKGVFTAPAETTAAFAAKANIVMIAILLGGQAIVNMLVKLFNMLIANSKAKSASSLDDIYDLINSYVSTKKAVYSTGDIFLYMFKEVLLVVVAAAVGALVIWLLVNAFDKANTTFLNALAAYSITCVLGIPAKLISWVVGLTSVGFLDELSTCVSVFSTVVGYVLVVLGVKAIAKREKSLPLILGITYVAINFVSWIVGLMF